ncbi:STAS domain-containing protein [Bacillota bacterium Lsc_1132]
MLDVSHNEMILAFEHLSDVYQEKMQKEMAELSAPIVLIKKDVAVLPLIGVIDSYRASYIMEKVVPKIADLQVEHVITDCSGILTIDLEIVHYLWQLSEVLLLLGVNVIFTGLRQELTQFIVNSGIDMSAIKTFAHVKQALEYIK